VAANVGELVHSSLWCTAVFGAQLSLVNITHLSIFHVFHVNITHLSCQHHSLSLLRAQQACPAVGAPDTHTRTSCGRSKHARLLLPALPSQLGPLGRQQPEETLGRIAAPVERFRLGGRVRLFALRRWLQPGGQGRRSHQAERGERACAGWPCQRGWRVHARVWSVG
jgi:hypothetical protein